MFHIVFKRVLLGVGVEVRFVAGCSGIGSGIGTGRCLEPGRLKSGFVCRVPLLLQRPFAFLQRVAVDATGEVVILLGEFVNELGEKRMVEMGFGTACAIVQFYRVFVRQEGAQCLAQRHIDFKQHINPFVLNRQRRGMG